LLFLSIFRRSGNRLATENAPPEGQPSDFRIRNRFSLGPTTRQPLMPLAQTLLTRRPPPIDTLLSALPYAASSFGRSGALRLGKICPARIAPGSVERKAVVL